MRLYGAGLITLATLWGMACSAGTDDKVFGSGDSSNTSVGGGSEGGANEGGVLLGNGGNTGGDVGSGCEKVDFLFIIDNSVSMADQQAALIASFPTFMATIQTTLSATSDYQIMVADTDDETRCTPSNCQSGAMSANSLCIAPANGYACTPGLFDTCDNTIGAGVVHPAGDGASNMPCTIFGGNRYIGEGEPNRTSTFSCMAQVGLAGHPAERPMDSLVAAMSDTMNGPNGCNTDFLRDDAILVITFISDDPNYEDADGPQQWYDAVVAVKDPESVVVLGLTPNFNGCQDGKGPPKGQHWSDFIAMWGARGLEASVCELDYGPFFDQAISIIDQTCDEFDPPK